MKGNWGQPERLPELDLPHLPPGFKFQILRTMSSAQSLPPRFFYVAMATFICCNSNMEDAMNGILEVILQRRAVKVFEPVEISRALREQILDSARHAPSSFNMQPYRFYWVGSAAQKAAVAKLCLGQRPAETASALVVAVADIGTMPATSRGQWGRVGREGCSEREFRDFTRSPERGRNALRP